MVSTSGSSGTTSLSDYDSKTTIIVIEPIGSIITTTSCLELVQVTPAESRSLVVTGESSVETRISRKLLDASRSR
jgi:hypothetical protein